MQSRPVHLIHLHGASHDGRTNISTAVGQCLKTSRAVSGEPHGIENSQRAVKQVDLPCLVGGTCSKQNLNLNNRAILSQIDVTRGCCVLQHVLSANHPYCILATILCRRQAAMAGGVKALHNKRLLELHKRYKHTTPHRSIHTSICNQYRLRISSYYARRYAQALVHGLDEVGRILVCKTGMRAFQCFFDLLLAVPRSAENPRKGRRALLILGALGGLPSQVSRRSCEERRSSEPEQRRPWISSSGHRIPMTTSGGLKQSPAKCGVYYVTEWVACCRFQARLL